MNNARYYIVAFLMLALATQLLHRAVFIGYFKFYRATIAQTHCINKDKPELECEGKCHLKKYVETTAQQGQEAENTQSPTLPNLEFFKNFNPYYIYTQSNRVNTVYDTHLNFLAVNFSTLVFSYTDRLGRNYAASIFHPPILV